MNDAMTKATEVAASFPAAFSVASVALFTTVLTGLLILLAWAARKMPLALELAIRPVLSIFVSLSFVGAIFLTMIRAVPENEGTGLLLGGLIAAFANIVAYYFNNREAPAPDKSPPSEEPPP